MTTNAVNQYQWPRPSGFGGLMDTINPMIASTSGPPMAAT
jgi:hypothetical protein